MEYIYAALILHQAGKKINGESIKRIIEAAGITPDEAKIRALVASLEGVDVAKTLAEAKAMPAAAPVAAPSAEHVKAEEKEKKKEEKKEEAAEGLSALFS